MQKLKALFFSEKGMGIVNALFFLSVIFRKGVITLLAYLVWAVYLFFCRKHAESKESKIVYTVFLSIAIILVCVNLYLLF